MTHSLGGETVSEVGGGPLPGIALLTRCGHPLLSETCPGRETREGNHLVVAVLEAQA